MQDEKGILPLAWEKGICRALGSVLLGYTPTRVGKSFHNVVPLNLCEVYSHSRGKKEKNDISSFIFIGILPLAWEKVLR